MWSRLPSRFVARMLTGHAATGLAASALLYVLCLSGTLMVFHQEFARWEQPGVPEFEGAAPEAVAGAARNALSRAGASPHHLYLSLPLAGMPRLAVTADEQSWYADSAGELAGPVAHPWTHFIEKLHYYLTLPGVWGLTVVGILGVLMTGLVLSGLLAHPKLFRDAFRMRLAHGGQIREADIHNRLGAWASPFHLVVAATGAILGLASLVAVALSQVHGDGDTEALFNTIFGAEQEGGEAPAPLADIAAALRNFEAAHPDLEPWYVTFHDPATAGQQAEILAKHPRRLVYGDEYAFGPSGTLTGNTGLSDGYLGQQVAASLYPLHFGSFGGLPVRLAYGLLGLSACVVVATGLNIWFNKRRQRGRPVPVLERAWRAVVWGTPAVLAMVLFASVLGIDGEPALIGLFWGVLLAVVAAACMVRSGPRAHLQLLTGALLLAVVASHAWAHGAAAASGGAWAVSGTLVLVALALVTAALRERWPATH